MILKALKFLLMGFVVLNAMSSSAFSDSKIKTPNVAGQFYESNPKRLSKHIETFFKQAPVTPLNQHIDIMIAPHAGYVYSGGVAAYGFKAISQRKYKTVVILAPSHYVRFDEISIWKEGGFQTPLGVVEVDDQFSRKLIEANENFSFKPEAFEQEHSLEVEIPFLQKTLKDFKIVPVIMGQPSLQLLKDFAATRNTLIAHREDVLILVSTDFSHYHDDAFARAMDSRTIEAIKGLAIEQIWKEHHNGAMEMCGFMPVMAALLYAKQRGLDSVDVLRYTNSSDVSGDKDRVVGYGSLVIYGESNKPTDAPKDDKNGMPLNLEQKKKLVTIARKTIDAYVQTGKKLKVTEEDSRLALREGAFVTIHKDNHLRGCIGHIIGQQPLYLTVRDMAISSATQDPRFPPVKQEELDKIDVEVSVLSRPRVVDDIDEIQLGVHGVIVSRGPLHRGVFLPQVATETGWTKEEFLSQLCSQKANLPADAWKNPKTKIEIFTAEVFSESDLQ